VVGTRVQTEDRISRVESQGEASTPPSMATKPSAIATPKQRTRRVSPFWRHYMQMAAVMALGMFATGAILLVASGAETWEQVTTRYPNQALLGMAAGMTLPMVAWMLLRGMGRRNSYEMAAAMILPVIPFLCLVQFGITKDAQCGGYCAVTFVAMYALMRYRRSAYRGPTGAPSRIG
jgi:cytochrome bd-type quinol oxidase subunit 2